VQDVAVFHVFGCSVAQFGGGGGGGRGGGGGDYHERVPTRAKAKLGVHVRVDYHVSARALVSHRVVRLDPPAAHGISVARAQARARLRPADLVQLIAVFASTNHAKRLVCTFEPSVRCFVVCLISVAIHIVEKHASTFTIDTILAGNLNAVFQRICRRLSIFPVIWLPLPPVNVHFVA